MSVKCYETNVKKRSFYTENGKKKCIYVGICSRALTVEVEYLKTM